MIDREKVIKGLQIHADGCGYRSHHCDAMECPYRYGDESCDIEEMCRDALALLKEQEAVKPYVTGRGESFETAETWWYACGNCHEALDPDDKYCRHCGRAVVWSD